MKRPRWRELTKEQKQKFGNGFGPSWMPDFLRDFITKKALWFFKKANYKHRDFGYYVGHTEWDR